MSRPRLNLTGEYFGRLRVLSYAGKDRSQNTRWLCLCTCGNKVEVRGSEMRRGTVSSCGCLKKERQRAAATKDGYSGNRLYRIWRQMIARTSNPKHISFPNYGGRGIKVCQKWQDDFVKFESWAAANGYADNLSIDRIENDQGYSPDNCKWATAKEQAANRRPRSCFRKKKEPKEMKKFKKTGAQGEITTDVVDQLPDGAQLRKVKPVQGRLVVSHSEQGHDHYIPACDAELLERTDNVPAGMQIFYSIVKNPTALKQNASTPHDAIALDAKIYRHRVSREFDPFAEQARRVAD